MDYWILTYGAVFVFTIYNSYKIAVENNMFYEPADNENAPLQHSTLTKLNGIMNYLSKRSPIAGALWSLFLPVIGAVYTHGVLTGVFEVIWWNTILIKSHILASIEYTFVGEFDKAVSILDPEWVLFIPSMLNFYGLLYLCYYHGAKQTL